MWHIRNEYPRWMYFKALHFLSSFYSSESIQLLIFFKVTTLVPFFSNTFCTHYLYLILLLLTLLITNRFIYFSWTTMSILQNVVRQRLIVYCYCWGKRNFNALLFTFCTSSLSIFNFLLGILSLLYYHGCKHTTK